MAEEHTEHRHGRGFMPDEAREHLKAAGEEIRKSVEGMFPPGFVEHRRAARREMLLAARSLIEAALKRMETPEAK